MVWVSLPQPVEDGHFDRKEPFNPGVRCVGREGFFWSGIGEETRVGEASGRFMNTSLPVAAGTGHLLFLAH